MMHERVSVIIPVYNSHSTIQRCAEGLRRVRHNNVEYIFVDSSPDTRSEILMQSFPEFHYIRSHERLLMHNARNLGVQQSHGDIIIFTDPDCIPDPEWISRLVEPLQNGYHVAGGPVACYPGGTGSMLAHLVKFWKWLPNGHSGVIDDIVTANFAVSRDVFLSVGGFTENYYAGDTDLCNRIREKGYSIYFESGAVVTHIHEQTIASLISERLNRGYDYGKLRMIREQWGLFTIIVYFLLMPVIALRQWWWKCSASVSHRFGGAFFLNSVLIFVCDIAWVLGVSFGSWSAYKNRLA